jgi:hypothetical protein
VWVLCVHVTTVYVGTCPASTADSIEVAVPALTFEVSRVSQLTKHLRAAYSFDYRLERVSFCFPECQSQGAANVYFTVALHLQPVILLQISAYTTPVTKHEVRLSRLENAVIEYVIRTKFDFVSQLLA